MHALEHTHTHTHTHTHIVHKLTCIQQASQKSCETALHLATYLLQQKIVFGSLGSNPEHVDYEV